MVVLNHDFWQQRFGGDPTVVGRKTLINNYPMTIVGVAAPGFQGVTLGYTPNIHIPVTMKRQVTPSWDDLENRRSRWLQVFARLKPGVRRELAENSIATLYKSIIQDESKEPEFKDVSAYSLEQFLASHAVVLPGGQGFSNLRRQLEDPLWILMALVGLVLLIACANVSSLQVARGAARRRDMSIRRALGATRGDIVRQLLVESLMLAGIGTVLGLVVSYGTTRAILFLAPDEQTRLAFSTALDARVLAFNLVVAVGAALLFGLAPALQLSGGDVFTPLKEQSGSVTGGAGVRLRKSLVALQVALSLLLLMGSGLFIQSLMNLRDVDAGFQADNLLRFKLDPMLSGYDVAGAKQFYERLQRRLEALPGVESAALSVVAIMEGDEWDSSVSVEGYQSVDGEDMNPHFNSISPDYFKTLGMAVLEGQDFDEQIGTPDRKAVVVNETFARRYFGERSPVGYHMGFGTGPGTKLDMEICGVVEDAKYEGLREEIPRQVFVSYRQNEWASEMTGYVRTSLPSTQMFSLIRDEVRAMDSKIPLFDMATMQDTLDRSLALERLVAFLSGAFALLATILAVVGLYGVSSYNVARRLREIGIRLALGAESGRIVWMVLREVLTLAGVGIAIGLPAGWWLTSLAESQLYGVEARDPLSLALASVGLLTAAVLSGALPAYRAARTDPVRVLRYE